jgi:hypothetical protein
MMKENEEECQVTIIVTKSDLFGASTRFAVACFIEAVPYRR